MLHALSGQLYAKQAWFPCTTINISHACLHEVPLSLESNKYANASAHMIRVCLCGRFGRGAEQTAGKPGCGGGGEAAWTVQINRRGESSPAAHRPSPTIPPYSPLPEPHIKAFCPTGEQPDTGTREELQSGWRSLLFCVTCPPPVPISLLLGEAEATQ